MKSEIFSYEVTWQFNKLVGYYHKIFFLIFMFFYQLFNYYLFFIYLFLSVRVITFKLFDLTCTTAECSTC